MMRSAKSKSRSAQRTKLLREALKMPGVADALDVYVRSRRAIEIQSAVDNVKPRAQVYAAADTCGSAPVLEG